MPITIFRDNTEHHICRQKESYGRFQLEVCYTLDVNACIFALLFTSGSGYTAAVSAEHFSVLNHILLLLQKSIAIPSVPGHSTLKCTLQYLESRVISLVPSRKGETTVFSSNNVSSVLPCALQGNMRNAQYCSQHKLCNWSGNNLGETNNEV